MTKKKKREERAKLVSNSRSSFPPFLSVDRFLQTRLLFLSLSLSFYVTSPLRTHADLLYICERSTWAEEKMSELVKNLTELKQLLLEIKKDVGKNAGALVRSLDETMVRFLFA